MRLLITNDDGISAKGIYALAKELEKEHEVVVVAPDNQRSACGHSITLNRTLKVKKVNLEGIKSDAYSVDGTPADCVRIGIKSILKGEVDMVVSGINNGLNIGIDVVYSGTVSAAMEASINNVPSVAVSTELTDVLEDYYVAAKYASRIVKKAGEIYQNKDVVLNVNVPLLPEDEILGVKACKMGNMIYDNNYVSKQCDEKEFDVDIVGSINPHFHKCSDKYYVKNRYVTITPLQYDLTNYKLMREVTNYFEE